MAGSRRRPRSSSPGSTPWGSRWRHWRRRGSLGLRWRGSWTLMRAQPSMPRRDRRTCRTRAPLRRAGPPLIVLVDERGELVNSPPWRRRDARPRPIPYDAQEPPPVRERTRVDVRVDRLIDALGGLDQVLKYVSGPATADDVRRAHPYAGWSEEADRLPRYAPRRIKHFVLMLNRDESVDPIEIVACRTSDGQGSRQQIVLLQGYHRLLAHKYAGRPSIVALAESVDDTTIRLLTGE